MHALLASGRIVDVILVLMVVEGVALTVLWRLRGRGVPGRRLLPMLAAGGALMMALRGVLVGSGTAWVLGWLLVGLVAHLADLRARWT